MPVPPVLPVRIDTARQASCRTKCGIIGLLFRIEAKHPFVGLDLGASPSYSGLPQAAVLTSASAAFRRSRWCVSSLSIS
jgi:hypothetical protein